jgi:hypothetical protein
MPAVAKLCTVCGEDVAGKKRMKDPQGHYYCETCYSAKLAKNKAKSFKTAIGAAVPLDDDAGGVALATEPTPPPSDDGLLDLLPEKKPEAAADEEMFGCSGCKKIVAKRQIRNLDGEFLCSSCYGKHHAQQRANAPKYKPVAKKDDEFADEHPETWKDTFIGGATISAIIFVLGCAAFIGLNYAVPARGAGEHRLVLAIAYGGVSAAFLIFRVVCLMISMIVASKIMGGMTFGSIGSALYKTFAFFSIYGIADFFFDRSESFAMMGWGIRFAAFVVCFIALYGLDYFEAVLLSIINMGMSWVLAIGMGLTLFAVLSAVTGHHSDDENDLPNFHHQQLQQQNNGAAPGGAAPGNNQGGGAGAGQLEDGGNFPYPLP